MTQTYDLIVRGGEVVNHAGRGMADVGVKDGRIEIQGDKREEVARILSQAGFRPVFAGG